MDEKQAVQVTIFHQTYTLRTSGNEREVQELADSVDQLMNAIAARSASGDSLRVAVLACLHVADRLRSLERDFDELRRRVEEKSQKFQLLLDEVIGTRDSG